MAGSHDEFRDFYEDDYIHGHLLLGYSNYRMHLEIQDYFYLLFTPLTKHLKIGKASGVTNLERRLEERIRQCGETVVLGVKFCSDPQKEEREWKRKLKKFAISKEVFDISSFAHWRDCIGDFMSERGLVDPPYVPANPED